ncbi:MAG: hypothetical protein Q7U35_04430 [Methanobacteriaceae archaeon]|nr:hypothetical protein [Methanobacteriaceae archaeon]MDP2835734.1 hypothetical protein [Methanobacteriaceae archaeon]MDP3035846.1 hypothetical protein [Methanobacteriaceae archaeon]MDP3486112.1 hypothetical protein [Methanobacteriaceae archaeon]MDP3622712.1 hypothetical protein [Methanobacteriaceae archaeon]
MKIKFITILTILFAIFSLQVIGPVAAIQNGDLIDHGTKYTTTDTKCVWKTYAYPENTMKIFKTYYYKENGKWVRDFGYFVTLEKDSSIDMKISQEDAWGTSIRYETTQFSANDYYWKIYRPEWLEN